MLPVVLLLIGAGWQPPPAPPADRVSALRLGMRGEEVRSLLGPPGQVSRQAVWLRCLEQWHYGRPYHLSLQFSAPRGQAPVLAAIRRSHGSIP